MSDYTIFQNCTEQEFLSDIIEMNKTFIVYDWSIRKFLKVPKNS